MIDSSYHHKDWSGIQELLEMSQEQHSTIFRCRGSDGGEIQCAVTTLEGGILKVHVGEPTPSEIFSVEDVFAPFLPETIENSEVVVLRTEAYSVAINKSPWQLAVYKPDGETLLKEENADVDPVGKRQAISSGYSREPDGSVHGCNLCFSLPHNEHFFGFGESFSSFDKRGQCVDIWNIDALGVRTDESYKNVPFFISSRGYGFFLNHSGASRFQMGSVSSASWQVHAEGKGLEYFIIPGENAAEIIGKYTGFSGRAPMLPLWSFGTWVSNGFYNADRESMMETAQRLRTEGIPADVLHFDCYWLRDRKWCDLVWNTERFPDPEQMISRLREDGFRSCLWINPYISIESDLYSEGVERGFFLRDARGEVLIRDVWHGLEPHCAFIDFTREEEVSWYEEKLSVLIDMGIPVLKTDFGEDIPVEACYANGRSGSDMHNLYSVLYNRTVFNLIKRKTEEGIVWSRAGFAGSQEFPVCWAGDPATSFPAMAAVLRGGLSHGVSGVPFWSHDIGGFYGPPPSPELYVRWAQFGLFSSHARCHGTTPRDPWEFGDEALRIFRKYASLRYSLMPYIVTEAKTCSETGLPFIRPLWINSFDDPTCFMIDDQYLFGSSIMVAPVIESSDTRTIYIPEGIWYDFHSGERFEGRRWITYPAPLKTLPLFVREGTIIPRVRKPIQHTGEIDWSEDIVFEIYGEPVEQYQYYSPADKCWKTVPGDEDLYRRMV